MKHTTVFLLGLFCFFLLTASKVQNTKILILGDSLTDGYGVSSQQAFPALLEQKLKATHPTLRVINAGSSGATSSSGLSRFRWFLKQNPTHLLLVLGSNDGLRGLDVQTTKKNLEKIILKAQQEGLQVILAGLQIPPNYGPQYTKQFKAMIPELAQKYNLPLIPFLLDKVAGVEGMNQADGIHPNEKGHEQVALNILPVMQKVLAQ